MTTPGTGSNPSKYFSGGFLQLMAEEGQLKHGMYKKELETYLLQNHLYSAKKHTLTYTDSKGNTYSYDSADHTYDWKGDGKSASYDSATHTWTYNPDGRSDSKSITYDSATGVWSSSDSTAEKSAISAFKLTGLPVAHSGMLSSAGTKPYSSHSLSVDPGSYYSDMSQIKQAERDYASGKGGHWVDSTHTVWIDSANGLTYLPKGQKSVGAGSSTTPTWFDPKTGKYYIPPASYDNDMSQIKQAEQDYASGKGGHWVDSKHTEWIDSANGVVYYPDSGGGCWVSADGQMCYLPSQNLTYFGTTSYYSATHEWTFLDPSAGKYVDYDSATGQWNAVDSKGNPGAFISPDSHVMAQAKAEGLPVNFMTTPSPQKISDPPSTPSQTPPQDSGGSGGGVGLGTSTEAEVIGAYINFGQAAGGVVINYADELNAEAQHLNELRALSEQVSNQATYDSQGDMSWSANATGILDSYNNRAEYIGPSSNGNFSQPSQGYGLAKAYQDLIGPTAGRTEKKDDVLKNIDTAITTATQQSQATQTLMQSANSADENAVTAGSELTKELFQTDNTIATDFAF